jgi:hypothetical protein
VTLIEFNAMELYEKYRFLFSKRGDNHVGFNCFRDDDDYKFSLWDCDSFLAEMCALNGKVLKIEGIKLTDDRINLYINWLEEHMNDPKYQ